MKFHMWQWLHDNYEQAQAIGGFGVAATLIAYAFLVWYAQRQFNAARGQLQTMQDQLKSMKDQLSTTKEMSLYQNTFDLIAQLHEKTMQQSIEWLTGKSKTISGTNWDSLTLTDGLPALAAFDLAALMIKHEQVNREIFLGVFEQQIRAIFPAAQQISIQKGKRESVMNYATEFLELAKAMGCK
jgi:hypothetical protein